MKKLLVLNTYPAPYRTGMYKYFKKCFDCVFFCESSYGDGRDAKWFEGDDCYVLDTERGRKKYSSMKLTGDDIVAIYEFSTITANVLILKCIQKHIPYIINCDGVMLKRHGNPIRDLIKRYLIKNAAAYLASGENARQYFLKYGANPKKIFLHTFSTLEKEDILDVPVSAGEKMALRKKLSLPADCKIAIAVGRFIQLKRYNELLCAWKAMPDNYYLLLIGGGEEEGLYRDTIHRLGLNNIIIEPFHLKNDLFEYYKAADVFVHPTSYDVWGLVINEAMACGLPIVVSDRCIAGLELVRDGENGYKVSMGDDNKMCQRVIDILSDEQTCKNMAQNAIDTIRPYTIENMAKTHIEVFNKVINGAL